MSQSSYSYHRRQAMAKKKKKQQSRPSSPKQQRVDLVQEAFRYSAAAFHSTPSSSIQVSVPL